MSLYLRHPDPPLNSDFCSITRTRKWGSLCGYNFITKIQAVNSYTIPATALAFLHTTAHCNVPNKPGGKFYYHFLLYCTICSEIPFNDMKAWQRHTKSLAFFQRAVCAKHKGEYTKIASPHCIQSDQTLTSDLTLGTLAACCRTEKEDVCSLCFATYQDRRDQGVAKRNIQTMRLWLGHWILHKTYLLFDEMTMQGSVLLPSTYPPNTQWVWPMVPGTDGKWGHYEASSLLLVRAELH